MPGPRSATWVFDPLPPSRSRRGDDPAGHAFPHDVDAFVREVIQNANDQALGAPEVHFRLDRIAGDALPAFLAALGWADLEPHLRAAIETPSGATIRDALDQLDTERALVVLRIEDRNTVGLTGAEREGESNFRALCRDVLFSHKPSDTAGGSYGLGKSVLWTFSGLRTVFFHSTLSEHGPGQVSPRLLGRAELPSHVLPDGRAFAGPGWFGRVAGDGDDRWAESVWGQDAARVAAKLGIARTQTAGTGTTILVVGFRDPTEDLAPSLVDRARAIRAATLRHFWPALRALPGRPLVVWVATPQGGGPIRLEDAPEYEPFCLCYERRDDPDAALERPGDVVVREIPIRIPRLRSGGPAVDATVRLCVRYAADGEAKLQGHVAWFRGPGMVVTYKKRRNIALAARPFHAVLACGRARRPEAPTAADEAVERFLRAAEPPGHDDWRPTEALKARYGRGYRKALDDMFRAVDAALREILVPAPRHGAPGPDLLRRRFPLGRSGPGKAPPPPVFEIRDLSARFEGGRWHFEGRVVPENLPAAGPTPPWSCTIRLFEVDADGAFAARAPIEGLATDPAVPKTEIRDGEAHLEVGPRRLGVTFSGRSAPVPGGERIEIALEVTGRHG